jgi:hypothetical protein
MKSSISLWEQAGGFSGSALSPEVSGREDAAAFLRWPSRSRPTAGPMTNKPSVFLPRDHSVKRSLCRSASRWRADDHLEVAVGNRVAALNGDLHMRPGKAGLQVSVARGRSQGR